MSNPITAYLRDLEQNLAAGHATEHTHRAALAQLIQSLADHVHAVNEPKHRSDCGAPDFVILQIKGNLALGDNQKVAEDRAEAVDPFGFMLTD